MTHSKHRGSTPLGWRLLAISIAAHAAAASGGDNVVRLTVDEPLAAGTVVAVFQDILRPDIEDWTFASPEVEGVFALDRQTGRLSVLDPEAIGPARRWVVRIEGRSELRAGFALARFTANVIDSGEAGDAASPVFDRSQSWRVIIDMTDAIALVRHQVSTDATLTEDYVATEPEETCEPEAAAEPVVVSEEPFVSDCESPDGDEDAAVNESQATPAAVVAPVPAGSPRCVEAPPSAANSADPESNAAVPPTGPGVELPAFSQLVRWLGQFMAICIMLQVVRLWIGSQRQWSARVRSSAAAAQSRNVTRRSLRNENRALLDVATNAVRLEQVKELRAFQWRQLMLASGGTLAVICSSCLMCPEDWSASLPLSNWLLMGSLTVVVAGMWQAFAAHERILREIAGRSQASRPSLAA